MANVAWRLVDHAKKKLKEVEGEFKEAHEEARKYKLIPFFRVVRNVPKSFFDQPEKVVLNFLESKVFLWSTNEEIAEIVAARIAPYPLPTNFMDKPLSSKQLKAIGAIMAKADLAFDQKVQKSLSKIKLAIQAGKAAMAAELNFTGTISFGQDYVTVGTKRFPFKPDANGFQRIKVGNQKLRVDVLRAFVEAGNLPSSTS